MTSPGHGDLFADDVLLTDGGIETVLLFREGIDLPAFAAFPLVDDEKGRDTLRRYYIDYLLLAAGAGRGFVLETPTWRANPDWGALLGYSAEDLRRVNHDSVALAQGLRAEWTGDGRVLISGCIGPRGDGYVPGVAMSALQAAAYHRPQVRALAEGGADLVTAFTLSYVDSATASSAAWFMINCAHPEHVLAGLAPRVEPWLSRIGAYRANASRMSHAELDEAEALDEGDPQDLAAGYVGLCERLPALRVLGGCCGTDVRHVAAVSSAWGTGA